MSAMKVALSRVIYVCEKGKTGKCIKHATVPRAGKRSLGTKWEDVYIRARGAGKNQTKIGRKSTIRDFGSLNLKSEDKHFLPARALAPVLARRRSPSLSYKLNGGGRA